MPVCRCVCLCMAFQNVWICACVHFASDNALLGNVNGMIVVFKRNRYLSFSLLFGMVTVIIVKVSVHGFGECVCEIINVCLTFYDFYSYCRFHNLKTKFRQDTSHDVVSY